MHRTNLPNINFTKDPIFKIGRKKKVVEYLVLYLGSWMNKIDEMFV
jgi:hypothetical protein